MCFFFFKQKTAYEMRISDWSSDVCSSDLRISVDLFDTLLLRPFLSPAGFHDYLKPGYAAVRRQAEQAARLSEGRDPDLDAIHRSDERSGGKECFRTCRSRWSTHH